MMSENTDRASRILKRLPGMNCMACGFGSCAEMAKAAASNPQAVKKCLNLSQEDMNSIIGMK
jgi:Na+-translocating ferredoxin:NAD+ oxidoreductase RNF subunit RnfB